MEEFYVYAYCDPRKKCNKEFLGFCFEFEPFYIGKGKADRKLVHLEEFYFIMPKFENGEIGLKNVHRKLFRIRKIFNENFEPIINIVAEGCNEEESLKIENKLTTFFGLKEEGGCLLNYKHGGSGSTLPEEKRIQISETLKEGYKTGRITVWNKGVKFSDELRKKLSESAKNKPPISEETREKLRKRVPWNKGKKINNEPWNKGKKNCFSQETLDKMSKSLSGREVWNKGLQLKEETKKKISNSKKGSIPWNKGISMGKNVKHSQLLKSKYDNGEMEPWNKGIKYEIVSCPYCKKQGAAHLMKRYHFGNCKKK